MRISDWSSDECSSDLQFPLVRGSLPRPLFYLEGVGSRRLQPGQRFQGILDRGRLHHSGATDDARPEVGHLLPVVVPHGTNADLARSEEHTSELQSLMRISYAVFCLKTKKQ